jgi:DNA-binding GntR family transcriptional regulator
MRVNQAQKAYTEIHKQLIARNIEPQQRLREKEWALELSVNRADIRQAFARLVGEGLLITGDKGGAFAREFTEEQMTEYNELRLILETAAAKLAVERATDEELALLEDICSHMELIAKNGYLQGVNEADFRFHEVLVKMMHNKEFAQLYESANLPISMAKKTTVIDAETLESNASDHRAIFDALRDKDTNKLVQLLRAGLEKTNNLQPVTG